MFLTVKARMELQPLNIFNMRKGTKKRPGLISGNDVNDVNKPGHIGH